MPIQLFDSGNSLRFIEDNEERKILKSTITGIEILDGHILKFLITQGIFHHIYVRFADVTFPITANAEQMRDFLLSNWLAIVGSGGGGGGQVEIDQFNKLVEIATIEQEIRLQIQQYTDPLLVDDTNPNVMYKGYAEPASLQTDPVWRISRTTKTTLQTITEWADGNMLFDNSWVNRAGLIYS